jgi:hypothetical protein
MAQLWEKLQFWKKKQMKLEKGIHFDYVDFDNTDITGIILMVEEFKDVIYHYHRAELKEEGGVARLSFGYTIVSPGNHDIDGLNKNENFHTIMGDILTEILIAKADDEQIRTDYSKEFNTQ